MVITPLFESTNSGPFDKPIGEFGYNIALCGFQWFTCISTNDKDVVIFWNCGVVINSVTEWPIRIAFPKTEKSKAFTLYGSHSNIALKYSEYNIFCRLFRDLAIFISRLGSSNNKWLTLIVCDLGILMSPCCLTRKLSKSITIETLNRVDFTCWLLGIHKKLKISPIASAH